MSKFHLAYLNLGSNIEPEKNLPKGVDMLSNYGEILKISNVWESEPVGTEGSNYLNVCVLFKSTFDRMELKEQVTRVIEMQLGRIRGPDKYAPRSMDIDVVLFDEIPTNANLWSLAYVVVPLADIYPEFRIPESGEAVGEAAIRLRQDAWMEARRGIIV